MATDPLQAIRDIALTFPEATEVETWGHPTFRVRNRIFVSYGESDHGPQLTMKAAPGDQDGLLAEGDPFFLPSYVGSKGWIGIRVGPDTNWTEIGELVTDSYVQIAPRSLADGIGLASRPGTGARIILGVGNVIGEIVEGKPPKDQHHAVAEADDEDDDGLRLRFDPDDPSATSIDL